MRRFKYENGNVVTEKEYAQSLVKSFLAKHFENDSMIDEIETLSDANEAIEKLWKEWTEDPNTEEII